jgi:hypothetical protein
MKGRRLPDLQMGQIHNHGDIQAGDYWKVTDEGEPLISTEPTNLTGTIWYLAAPMSYGFALGRITKHTVREHEDGTISVLMTGHHGEQWHGYIDHGAWEPV